VQADEDFVDSSSENSLTTDRLEEFHGSTLSPGVIVLVRGEAPVTSARGQAQLERVVGKLSDDQSVARLSSALRAGPQGRAFISRDGRSSFIAVFRNKDAGDDDAERIEQAMGALPNVTTGGLAVAGPKVGDQVSANLAKAELLAFPLLFLLSLVIFRGAVAALLPLFVGFLTIMATLLGLRIVNEMTSLSIFALNLAIGLGLGLAIDYSLFVLSRYREEVARFGHGCEALAQTLHVAVSAPASAADRLRDYAAKLRARGDVAAVDRPQFFQDEAWQVEVVPAAPALDRRSLDLVRAVRAGPAPGTVKVAGESARFVDQRAGLGDRLPLAIAFLAITTLVILFAMTASVVLPLKALVMNLLRLSAAFGVLVFIFQDGRLEGLLDYTSQGSLEITQPLVLLAIAFGLSTDYGVFLLTRIKEARDAGASNDEAVAIGLQRTGRIVTAAALLLVVAIGAFATSQIVFIKQLGVGTAVAVAVDATIVRALLVPALMKLLGERNWWAPRPLKRLHERLRLGESSMQSAG